MQGVEWSCPPTAARISAILTRLMLLSLRESCLSQLADVLPANAVHTLRVLDLSGSCLGEEQPSWTTENMEAFASSNWANLQVLGIRPIMMDAVPSGMQAQAHALEVLLRQQAAAAQPSWRQPPIVVYSELNVELLQPSDNLAVVA
jgi:hypothetical protein